METARIAVTAILDKEACFFHIASDDHHYTHGVSYA